MKKSHLTFLCLVLTLTLAACETESNLPSDTVLPSMVSGHTSDAVYPVSDIPYNLQNRCNGGRFADAGDSVLLSLIGTTKGGITLMQYDKITGEVDTFCKDPLCNHDNDACPAGNYFDGLDTYKGVVYALRQKDSDKEAEGPTTPIVDWLCPLKNGRFDFLLGPSVFFYLADDKAYTFTPDQTAGSFPLGGGTFQKLREDMNDRDAVIIDGYLYTGSMTLGTMSRTNLNNPDSPPEELTPLSSTDRYAFDDAGHIYYNDENGDLVRVNLDGSDKTLVVSAETCQTHPSSFNYDAEYFYFVGIGQQFNTSYEHHGKLYRLRRDGTAEPEFLTQLDKEPSYTLYTTDPLDRLFMMANSAWYTVKKDGTDFHKLAMPDGILPNLGQ